MLELIDALLRLIVAISIGSARLEVILLMIAQEPLFKVVAYEFPAILALVIRVCFIFNLIFTTEAGTAAAKH